MQIISLRGGLGTTDFLQLRMRAITLTAGSCMREVDGPCLRPDTRYLVREPLPYRGGSRTVSSGVGLVEITLVAVPRDGFTTYSVFLLGRKARAGDQGPSSGSLLCPYLWTQQ